MPPTVEGCGSSEGCTNPPSTSVQEAAENLWWHSDHQRPALCRGRKTSRALGAWTVHCSPGTRDGGRCSEVPAGGTRAAKQDLVS